MLYQRSLVLLRAADAVLVVLAWMLPPLPWALLHLDQAGLSSTAQPYWDPPMPEAGWAVLGLGGRKRAYTSQLAT